MQVLETINELWTQARQDPNDFSFFHLNSTKSLFKHINSTDSLDSLKRGLGPHPHGNDELRLQIHIAHGVLATSAVVLLFPTVAIILRVISSPYIVKLHSTLQLLNVGILLVAFSLGCWLSWLDGWVSYSRFLGG